jgi:uncharacterized protein (TIGR02284 family)
MTASKDTLKALNTLLETSVDGQEGFRRCAEHVKSDELRQFFERHANECERAASELRQLITQLGGEPDSGGSASGAVHRGWVALKGAVGGESDLSMLEECERGEDVALARYRDCLKEDLTPEARMLVERQMQGVRQNHDEVKQRRDSLRAQAH